MRAVSLFRLPQLTNEDGMIQLECHTARCDGAFLYSMPLKRLRQKEHKFSLGKLVKLCFKKNVFKGWGYSSVVVLT